MITKLPKNNYKRWSTEEDQTLIEMIKKGKSTKQIARTLKRSFPSVWSRKYNFEQEGLVEGRIKRSKKTPVEKTTSTVKATPAAPAKASSPLAVSDKMISAISKVAKKNGVRATVIKWCSL